MSKAKFEKFPKELILRTPDGKIDVSANNRHVSAYDEDKIATLRSQILETQERDAEVGFGSGIEKPLIGRLVPAPAWQSKEGKVKKVLQLAQGHRRSIVVDQMENVKHVPALVYEDLPDADFARLIADQGEMPLRELELFTTMTRLMEMGIPQEKIVVRIRPTMERLWPLSDKAKTQLAALKTEDEKNKFLVKNPWRGRFQMGEQLVSVPFVLRDAMFNTLAGGSPKLLWSHLTTGHQAHLEDIGDIKTGNYNPDVTRANPGPKFNEFWANLQVELARAAAAGERPKSGKMLSQKEVVDRNAKTESLILREANNALLRVDGYDGEWFLKFHAVVMDLEKLGGMDFFNRIKAIKPAPVQKDDPGTANGTAAQAEDTSVKTVESKVLPPPTEQKLDVPTEEAKA